LRDGGTTLERIPETISESLAHVRSLAWFKISAYTPNLSLFKYLRVLIIYAGTGDTVDLTAISVLFQLRYLRVSTPEDARVGFPNKIRELVNLETFHIHGDKTSVIPSDIFLLPRLLHLMVPHEARLPKGIGKMKALHTLCGFKFSLKDIESLAELTNLRILKLCYIANFDIGTAGVDALVSSLEKLINLKYLAVDGRTGRNGPLWIKDEDNRLHALSDPPTHIEVLKLEYWMLYRIPNWIGVLMCLRCLTLHVNMMPAEDVYLLGRLPSLVELHLFVVHIPVDKIVEVGAGLFPVLEILQIENEHGNAMTFLRSETGSMPKLQQLFLLLPRGEWRGTTPVGMEHLLSLKGMYAIWNRSSGQCLREARAAFSKAIDLHPGHPSFTILYCPLVSNGYLFATFGSPLV
jgi:disease resistance protein RPM1